MSTTLEPTAAVGDRAASVSGTRPARRAVGRWLLVCAALIAAMVVLGGVTRLTGSGLSMTSWKPLHGVVPPVNAEQWHEEFTRYKASPEYRETNYGMSLHEFKRIFWYEYAHRMLGRVIGFAFLVPLLWFLAKRMVEPRLMPKLVVMFMLGGAQGLLGWWMVKSGLIDVPRVSAYRLTAHLGLALALYVWILWTAISLLRPSSTRPEAATSRLAVMAGGTLVFAFITVLSGGFVAGLRAGLVYNTFPTMGGNWIPPEIAAMSPWWRNPFENVATVQFDHRVLAMLLFVAVIALWVACLRSRVAQPVRTWSHAAAAAVVLQLGLGITTLLMKVPVPLAALHQANALIVMTALTGLALELGRGARAPAARTVPAGQ